MPEVLVLTNVQSPASLSKESDPCAECSYSGGSHHVDCSKHPEFKPPAESELKQAVEILLDKLSKELLPATERMLELLIKDNRPADDLSLLEAQSLKREIAEVSDTLQSIFDYTSMDYLIKVFRDRQLKLGQISSQQLEDEHRQRILDERRNHEHRNKAANILTHNNAAIRCEQFRGRILAVIYNERCLNDRQVKAQHQTGQRKTAEKRKADDALVKLICDKWLELEQKFEPEHKRIGKILLYLQNSEDIQNESYANTVESTIRKILSDNGLKIKTIRR